MSSHASTPQWLPMPHVATPASSISALPSPPNSESKPRSASSSTSMSGPAPGPLRAIAPTAAPGPSHVSGSSPFLPPTVAHAPTYSVPVNGNDSDNGRRRSELSGSIQMHTDMVMELIAEQRELAVQSASTELGNLQHLFYNTSNELEAVRAELRNTKGELRERRTEGHELQELQDRLEAMRSAAEFSERMYRERCEELQSVRRENEELKKRIAAGVNVIENAVAIVQANTSASQNSSPTVGSSGLGMSGNANSGEQRLKVESPWKERDTDASELRRRCEELERENERLKKSEANLLQRVEIFESLDAGVGTALQSTESFPDLNSVLEMLKGHRSIKSSSSSPATSQDTTHAKKRRLEATNGR